jgi:DNA-directed RNA polymerase subunit RPC12/RpoP
MSKEQASAYCDRCEKQVLIERPGGANHIFHLLMTILTCGIWILVWMNQATESPSWRCSECGKNLGWGSNGWGLIGSALTKKPENFEK